MTEKKKPEEKPKNTTKALVETQDKSPEPSPNWSLRILLGLVIFLLGSCVTVYFLPVLQDKIPYLDQWVSKKNDISPLIGQKISRLEDRLEKQESDIAILKIENSQLNDTMSNMSPSDPDLLDRLEKLEQTPSKSQKLDQNSSQSARIDMLLNRMNQLESSFVPLSKGLSDATDARLERKELTKQTTLQSEQLMLLENRLKKVEAFKAQGNNGILMAFHMGELRRTVSAGLDYNAEVERLVAISAKSPLNLNPEFNDAVNWFRQHKEEIKTPEQLRDHFNDLIPTIMRSATHNKNDSWWKNTYSSLKNLILVRKTGNFEKDSSDYIIAHVQQALNRRDIPDALKQIYLLPENMQATLNAWIISAVAYNECHNNLNHIDGIIADHYLLEENQEKEDNPS
ncbi:MAG: hypothetical protein K9G26_01880 [Emcibacter sp.]|nr:hypothetical protein [Emcibacter sp.]